MGDLCAALFVVGITAFAIYALGLDGFRVAEVEPEIVAETEAPRGRQPVIWLD